MDRYTKFARTWKSIGLSTKVKWHGAHARKLIAPLLLQTMVDSFGEEAIKIIEDLFYSIGKEDAKRLYNRITITKTNAHVCLGLIELICLLEGVETVFVKSDDDNSVLHIRDCPYRIILEEILPPKGKVCACFKYTQAIIESISDEAELKITKRLCEGDDFCEFIVGV
ncbi:MAG: L-2-amino-thiazoline-4-carboxylic acid hydrolase [Halobacteriota archaeon]|nr:L-2-amino-thiazoline-4-carboxylic acid hydrolase [Halobacteriota archaeon]